MVVVVPVARALSPMAIVLAMTIAGSSLSVSGEFSDLPVDDLESAWAAAEALSYTPHPRISINGDSDFASQASGNWPGDGTAENPYLIENYSISGSDYRNAISVGNTTVHFVIAGCYLYDSVECGILFYNVLNGVIADNTLFSNYPYGICLEYTNDTTVTNNSCSLSTYGIFLGWCENCVLIDNSCSASTEGIHLEYSPYIGSPGDPIGHRGSVLINNTCSANSADGIYLRYSSISVLSENDCSGNSGSGIRLLAYSMMNGLMNNTCSGNILAGIELSDSEFNNIMNNSCVGNGGRGILLSYKSDNNTLNGNICSGNEVGIEVDYYGGNIVIGNDCTYNTDSGIYLVGSDGNMISGNDCSNNLGYGIHFSNSDENDVHDNLCSDNSASGIYLDQSSSNDLTANYCDFNVLSGIAIIDSVYNRLRANLMVEDGVYLDGDSLQEWALQDIDETNLVNGKPVFYLVDGVGGSVPSGKGQAILANCRDVIIDSQNYSHGSIGIELGFCTDITVTDCMCSFEAMWGLYMSYSSSCNVSDSRFTEEASYGVFLRYSDDNQFAGNNCSQNVRGMILLDSSRNSISFNDCSFNTEYGMCLWNAHYNIVRNNSCSRGMTGVYLEGSSNNIILNNSCTHNSGHGILLYRDSNFNLLAGNLLFGNNDFGVSIELYYDSMGHSYVYSCYNTIYENIFVGNNGAQETYDPTHIQASDEGWGVTYNYWNSTTRGNFWSDWRSPDSNGDGIVDVPYYISGGSMGGTIARDYFPLTTSPEPVIPEFGVLVPAFLAAALCLIVCALWRRQSRR